MNLKGREIVGHILISSEIYIFFCDFRIFKLLSTSLIFARTGMSARAPPVLRGDYKFKVPENGALQKYSKSRL
jgi:hypothetical protein